MSGSSSRTLSYYHEPSTRPIIFETVKDRLKSMAEKYANKEAIVTRRPGDKRDAITFAELYAKSQTFAKYLIRSGVKKGNYVNMCVENSPEWAVIEFGIVLAGAVPVNNVAYQTMASFKPEVLAQFSGLVLDIRDDDTRAQILESIKLVKTHLDPRVTVLVSPAGYQLDVSNGYANFKDVMSNSALVDDVQLPKLTPEAICHFFLTSGSTGLPKLCAWNHMAVLNEAASFYASLTLELDDIFFNDRPLGYAGGYPYFVIHAGMTMVTVNSKRTVLEANADFVAQVIRDEHVTSGFIAPYLIFDLAPIAKSFRLKSVMTAGQRISRQHLLQASTFADNSMIAYGCTECLVLTVVSLSQIPTAVPDILGYTIPGTEAKIADDNGIVLPIGMPGELYVRECSMATFYLLQDGTKQVLRDELGWFPTGDVASMQNDGLITMCGRTKEIIKRGTMKIFPSSVEAPLRKHNSLEDVAVVGVSDARLYQEIVAFITLKSGQTLTEQELKQFACNEFEPQLAPDGRGLMPKYFYICEHFPKLPTGKIDAKALSAKAERLFSGDHKSGGNE